MNTVSLTIKGMSCQHCVSTVDRALKSVDGVQVEGVEIGSARVAYDPEKAGSAAIRAVVEDAGYAVLELESAS